LPMLPSSSSPTSSHANCRLLRRRQQAWGDTSGRH
jgi:hypothetical protein